MFNPLTEWCLYTLTDYELRQAMFSAEYTDMPMSEAGICFFLCLFALDCNFEALELACDIILNRDF